MPSASLDKSVIAVEIASSTVFLNFYNSHAFLFLFFTSILHLFPLVFALTFVSVAYFFFVLSRLFPPFSTVSFFQCSISAIKPDALELNVLVYFFFLFFPMSGIIAAYHVHFYFPLSDLGACLCVTHVYRLTSLLLSFLKLCLLSEKKRTKKGRKSNRRER